MNTGRDRAKVSLLFTWAVRLLLNNIFMLHVTSNLIHTYIHVYVYMLLLPGYSVLFVCYKQNSVGGVSHSSGDHVNEPFM